MTVIPTDAVDIKNPSPQLQAVLRWLDALTTELDVKALGLAIADDFTQQVLPQSLGEPTRTRAVYLEFADTFLMRVVKDLHLTLYEIVESSDKIVLHASSRATSATGHIYANEYTIIASLAQQPNGGYKIRGTKEFVDSRYSTEFFSAEAKRQEEAAKQA